MALASDGIVVGKLAISPAFFADPHFNEPFTSLPDLPSASDPNNTGKWDDEHWLIGKNLEGGWADSGGTTGIVLNKELQRYVSQRGPTPDGWGPFESTSDGLLVKARRVPDTAAYDEWARGKRYGEKGITSTAPFGGEDLFVSDFLNRSDIPGTEGYDWFEEGDGRIRWDRYQLDWAAGMLNTGNERASIDQGEFEVVGMMPYGAVFDPSGDVRDQSCSFAAWWLIQQFKVGHGRNRQPLQGGVTHYPFTGGDLLNEIDPLEHGGFDPFTNHNSRHMYYGETLQLLTDGEAVLLDGSGTPYLPSMDMTQVLIRMKCHITPEKIGMAIGLASGDCRYTRVIDTPEVFRQTRREYQLVSQYSDQVVRNSANVPVELGDLAGDDGPTMTNEYMALLNVAMEGRWLRERMIWERGTIMARGYTYPEYEQENGLDTASMLLRSCTMRKLIEAKFQKSDGSYWEPYKTSTPTTPTTPEVESTARLVIQAQPGFREGRAAQDLVAVAKDGYDVSGKVFTWSSDVPELTFSPQGGLVTTPSISGLTLGQLATIIIDDGEP